MNEASASAIVASRALAISERYRDSILRGMHAAIDGRSDVSYLGHVRYHLGWVDSSGKRISGSGGKLLRPLICLVCCEAVGGTVMAALPAAVAIELLHNFTLIHDDIEDRSKTRHGRDTLWRVIGIEQAINAGDGLFALAQRTLLDLRSVEIDDARVTQASVILNDACIALCEGQQRDLAMENRATVTLAEYESMISGKTAALLAAAAGMGALCGGSDKRGVDAFARIGFLLGLAFQIQDDVLGIWGDATKTGKSASEDIRTRKKSFPIAYAMEHLSESERSELARLYAEPNDERANARIVELLEAAGAREAGVASAELHLDEALAALRQLDLIDERRTDIEALATSFVRRDH